MGRGRDWHQLWEGRERQAGHVERPYHFAESYKTKRSSWEAAEETFASNSMREMR